MDQIPGREHFGMRICIASILALSSCVIVFGQPAAKLGANAPNLNYKETMEWPTPATNAAGKPAAWNFIQVSGVAAGARGTVLVLHRGAYPLLEFEADGKFVKSWSTVTFSEGKVEAVLPGARIPGQSAYSAVYGPAGCDSCGAHSIRIDPDHNIWVVDAPGQVIYKMDPKGKTIMRSEEH